MRLDKCIADHSAYSRKEVKELLRRGSVRVNGVPEQDPGRQVDPEGDEIMLAGVILPTALHRTYMLNKPKGYVTTMSDEKGRHDVTELVRGLGRIYPVGRLDMYSEGLLIMTDDGDFANTLMHPSHNLKKTYRTWVRGENIGLAAERLRGEIDIGDCTVRAESVDIERLIPDGAVLLITIGEGRNRQIRRMCACCGLKVERLVRISEGGLELGDLRPGRWRRLTDEEIKTVMGNGAYTK